MEIDVTGSSGPVSALELYVEGGGIGAGEILWEAVVNGAGLDSNVGVDSGSITVGLANQTGAHTISIAPHTDFDFVYVALDLDDYDDNDKMRINRIATVEEQLSDDVVLGFRLNADDDDGDHSPADPGYEEFMVTVQGDGPGTNNEGIIEVA